ncbi:MBL fold metallo-hydrolase [Ammoniphilus sp. 3BR4]|uniref:MBL fold metallo-hydrolase n=1 Tax=Ammoniphilus sp. 3BR4 TaxID=3158265 RepID=UPI003466D63B
MGTGKRLDTNIQGSFYVTTSCIDCDQCRQLAPEFFSEVGRYSAVTKQPSSPEEETKAFHALLSCPTGAIKSEKKEGLLSAAQSFPLLITEHIYYCGFTSRDSYGGSSYFIAHPEGNWLVDAPRWSPYLVQAFEKMGGVKYIFLTHRDDVADAGKYAEYFRAERFIHTLEKSAQPHAEHIIEGTDSIAWHSDFQFIMVPGHSKGHMVMLYRQKYLFTGDHLAWDREEARLTAYRDYCWHSWTEQTRSMERLAEEPFEWIFPGHGHRVYLPEHEMKEAMSRLVEWMKS